MQNETGIVWRDRDWEMKEQDLSINGFFIKHTEDTVKAFISKETGIVKSFMWFNERQGEFRLSREECFQKCIEFLQQVVPDYYDYMQLIVREVEVEKMKKICLQQGKHSQFLCTTVKGYISRVAGSWFQSVVLQGSSIITMDLILTWNS